MDESLIYNLHNIGYSVNTLLDFPNFTLPLGGEMSHDVAAHHLSQETALIGIFRGRNGYYHPPSTQLFSKEGHYLACVVHNEKVYVLIGKDGLPVLALPESVDSLVIPMYNHAIQNNQVFNLFDASRTRKRTPPATPRLI